VARVLYTFEIEAFERQEASNERRKTAPETDGAVPQYFGLIGGRQGQTITDCGDGTTARDTGPEDDNITALMRRWDIRRYTITGDVNADSTTLQLFQQHQSDRIKFGRFEAHQREVGKNISVTRLDTLALESFSYITTTSTAMYGKSIRPLGKLSAGSLIAATSLSTTVAPLFQVGQKVLVGEGTVGEEVLTVTSVAPTTLGVTAAVNAHSAGDLIQLYETNLLISRFDPEVMREITRADGVSTVRNTWEMVIESRQNKADAATS
jgi:hypothetical protein